MMRYEAVLFDLNGTLIDTVDDIGDAATSDWIHLANDLG